MTDFTCSECEEDFKAEFPYGSDVKCPHCRIWLSTDCEYDWDNMYAWVIGKSDDQEQE